MDWFISEAVACPVCYAANPKGLIAYYGTTILLILFPLILFGGLLWYLRRLLART